ncbi:MAG: hypothetical protein KBD06_05215 [Candidatus Pacebacteria bacterium]|nr:hypothetical protein [Candidatus Paceibacterota bacterium]
MLLKDTIPAIPAVLISVGILELMCSPTVTGVLGFGPTYKVALVLGFLITLLIWLVVSGLGARSEKEQEQE